MVIENFPSLPARFPEIQSRFTRKVAEYGIEMLTNPNCAKGKILEDRRSKKGFRQNR